ncbi:MAG: transcriptional repressor LexA [Nitrospirota bacterium]
MPEHLTERQKEVLEFIREYIEKEGISPTVREIAAHFGFASPLSAQLHINALSKKGYLTKAPFKTRNLKIIGLDKTSGRSIPLLGTVRAGKPVIALEEIDSYLTVDKNIFRNKDAFALRVTGDSMIEDGIFEGDIVLIKPEKDPINGSIAVVLINDEVTIKRFYKEKDRIRLVPANSSLQPATVSPLDAYIIGKVIGVIRKL